MVKKLCLAIIFSIVLAFSLLSVPAFAATGGPIDDTVYSAKTHETSSYFISITKPEEDKSSTYKKSYVISGMVQADSISVKVLRYNSDSGKYEELKDIDGVSTWDSGKSGSVGGNYGLFSREFALNKGDNKIRVVAYSNDSTSDKPDNRVQITDFIITRLDGNIFQDIFNAPIDIFNSIFK